MEQFHIIIVALIFNFFDLLTGILSGVKNKEIKSSKLRDGLFKKVAFICCYFLAWLLDTQGKNIGFEIGVSILPIIITYVCLTEVVSIIENICKINPDLATSKLIELFHISDSKENN